MSTETKREPERKHVEKAPSLTQTHAEKCIADIWKEKSRQKPERYIRREKTSHSKQTGVASRKFVNTRDDSSSFHFEEGSGD